MNYKAIFTTLFIGIVVFAVAVTLGMKYNWVKYLISEPAENAVAIEQAGLPQQIDEARVDDGINAVADQQTSAAQKTLHEKVKDFELVDEENLTGSSDELIRNDCIRASRRAGVTDANIFSVVNKCVEMSRQEQNNRAFPVEDPIEANPENNEENIQQPTVESAMELTRKACKIVADEEQGLTDEERNKVVEQCVKANMDKP